MYWLLEMTSARPRATCRPASVTMNGSSRKRVEMTPCMAPKAAPQATTKRTVGISPQPAVVMIVAVSTLERLSSAPTERSMPAVMMTKVMPTAMMPVSETARTMLAMLSGARNRMGPCRRGEKMTPPIATSDEADDALKADGDGEEVDARRRRGWRAEQVSRIVRGVIHRLSSCDAFRPRPAPRAHRRRPGNSATVRPRLSTTTRSQRPSSSGISLEAMRTPTPCAASSRMRA